MRNIILEDNFFYPHLHVLSKFKVPAKLIKIREVQPCTVKTWMTDVLKNKHGHLSRKILLPVTSSTE